MSNDFDEFWDKVGTEKPKEETPPAFQIVRKRIRAKPRKLKFRWKRKETKEGYFYAPYIPTTRVRK